MAQENVQSFIVNLRANRELTNRVLVPGDWYGGIETSCYITPKEICWFPWKKRLNSYNTEEFPDIPIQSAVDRCTYNYPEYGDVSYWVPSPFIRELTGIIDTDGTQYWDKAKTVRAAYCVTGEQWYTQQNQLIIDKNLLTGKLRSENKALVWIMQELRQESPIAKERFGDFYVEKRNTYIGFIKGNSVVVEEMKTEFSSSHENES